MGHHICMFVTKALFSWQLERIAKKCSELKNQSERVSEISKNDEQKIFQENWHLRYYEVLQCQKLNINSIGKTLVRIHFRSIKTPGEA